MSVAAERSHSPTHFGKRLYEPSEGSPELQRSPGTKRARTHSSASSHHREPLPQQAGALRASYLAALRGLFPNMEEKVRTSTKTLTGALPDGKQHGIGFTVKGK